MALSPQWPLASTGTPATTLMVCSTTTRMPTGSGLWTGVTRQAALLQPLTSPPKVKRLPFAKRLFLLGQYVGAAAQCALFEARSEPSSSNIPLWPTQLCMCKIYQIRIYCMDQGSAAANMLLHEAPQDSLFGCIIRPSARHMCRVHTLHISTYALLVEL